MTFSESHLESAIIELLGAEGYPHVLGETIERLGHEVLVKADVREFLAKQYAADGITVQEFDVDVGRIEKSEKCVEVTAI